MSASSAASRRRAPLLALWSRDDPRTAVIDFLPTRTIAALPFVAKSLHETQSRLLITAIKRRAKTTVPNPPTTRACLDALLVGEPQHIREDWKRGLEAWYRLGNTTGAVTTSHRLMLTGGSDDRHIGFARPLRGPSLRRLQNMLVTRFRVEMSFFLCPEGSEVGCVILCGPNSPADPGDLNEDADAISDLLYVLSFERMQGRHYLLFINNFGDEGVIVAGATPNTKYTVDVIFRHDSVTSGRCAADVLVNGQRVIQDMTVKVRPLSSIHLFNLNSGTSRIGNIDVWYERARPDQVWETGKDE